MKKAAILTIQSIGFCILVFGSMYIGYLYGTTRIPHLRRFQEHIGCKQIDCKVGDSWETSETQARWGDAYMKQTGKVMY